MCICLMNKENVIYTYNGILFSIKKERTSCPMLQHVLTLNTLLWEIKQLKKTNNEWLHLHEVYRVVKIMEMECRTIDCQGLRRKRNGSCCLFFYFLIFFISWRLITLQYCSGFCRTLTWISHGYTCIPHPNPPSHLSLHPIPLDLPSAPGPGTCLIWDSFLQD